MDWLTAEEALAILQTKPQTLYANVSRGRVRSKPFPDDPRRSLYKSEDVYRLAERRPGRKERERLLRTRSVGDCPSCARQYPPLRMAVFYRGYDASDLSPTATLEDVVALLWQAEPNERDLEIMDNREAVDGHPLERLFKVFGIRAANDLPSMGRSPSILKREAWDILQLFTTRCWAHKPYGALA